MIKDCFESPEDVDTLTRFDAGFRPSCWQYSGGTTQSRAWLRTRTSLR